MDVTVYNPPGLLRADGSQLEMLGVWMLVLRHGYEVQPDRGIVRLSDGQHMGYLPDDPSFYYTEECASDALEVHPSREAFAVVQCAIVVMDATGTQWDDFHCKDGIILKPEKT